MFGAAIVVSSMMQWAESFSQDIEGNDSASVGTSSNFNMTVLPIAVYNQVLQFGTGAFVGMRGLSQENMSLFAGGLISTNGTKYGFLKVREFYLPFFPRLYFEPDLLGGYFGVLKVYKQPPGAPPMFPADHAPAGSNESHRDDYLQLSGTDQWYELRLRYLLPIGHGAERVRFAPVLRNGILVSGETGATDWNPLKSGRTFVDLKPFYRKQIEFRTAGLEFALTHENVDFFDNPTRGFFQKLAFRRDWGGLGSAAPWSVVEGDWRFYIPLYDSSRSLPRVLAFNIWTVNTLTWNDYHVDGTNPDGSQRIIYHRPPPYTGAALGGRFRFRAYYEGRFNDRASIYYGMEYRHIIPWNPFNDWGLTRGLGIEWLQLAAFLEVGRVAPAWNLSTLHTDMKWSAGGGARIMMGGLILRLDGAFSPEGPFSQMYVYHAF